MLDVQKSLFKIKLGNQSLKKITLFEEKFTLLRDKYDLSIINLMLDHNQ